LGSSLYSSVSWYHLKCFPVGNPDFDSREGNICDISYLFGMKSHISVKDASEFNGYSSLVAKDRHSIELLVQTRIQRQMEKEHAQERNKRMDKGSQMQPELTEEEKIRQVWDLKDHLKTHYSQDQLKRWLRFNHMNGWNAFLHIYIYRSCSLFSFQIMEI
jgi:hypothetical protein